ncbi:MAG: class I SAM-dependent methyltransferase [Candidatus Omnitrophota bacterium]
MVNLKIEEVNDDLRFAYKFAASRITSSASVIDFGCGGGYGTEYLSRFTRNEVVGFDLDVDTINQNREFFKNINNLTFVSDEAKLRRYDVVVFFQVIEHLKRESIPLCLEKLKNLLNDSGTIYLATVNKNISSYELKKPILPFHIYEFNPRELSDLLSKYLHGVKCYGQIDQKLAKKVCSGEWSYSKYYDLGFRNKLIRIISQIELVRFIARHMPLFIKSFILGYGNTKPKRVNFKLTDVPLEIENSYILIYEGKK